jgi:hypothetical protein
MRRREFITRLGAAAWLRAQQRVLPVIGLRAARYAEPTFYPNRLSTEAGGLMSYGPDRIEPYLVALRARSPPTSSKKLGFEVPQSALLRADEVIE